MCKGWKNFCFQLSDIGLSGQHGGPFLNPERLPSAKVADGRDQLGAGARDEENGGAEQVLRLLRRELSGKWYPRNVIFI
jgi:hypothetical protein